MYIEDIVGDSLRARLKNGEEKQRARPDLVGGRALETEQEGMGELRGRPRRRALEVGRVMGGSSASWGRLCAGRKARL